jgi:hypothetical protein
VVVASAEEEGRVLDEDDGVQAQVHKENLPRRILPLLGEVVQAAA